jgi:hypothetical protein
MVFNNRGRALETSTTPAKAKPSKRRRSTVAPFLLDDQVLLIVAETMRAAEVFRKRLP